MIDRANEKRLISLQQAAATRVAETPAGSKQHLEAWAELSRIEIERQESVSPATEPLSRRRAIIAAPPPSTGPDEVDTSPRW